MTKKEVIRYSSRAKICISKSKCDVFVHESQHNTIQNFVMSDFKTDAIDQANALKEEGNKFLSGLSSLSLSAIVVFLIYLFYSLKEHKFELAVKKYTAALDACPTAIIYSNRAMAYIKMENYGLAIQDAREAISLDPKYIKAYYRRGSANFALGKFKVILMRGSILHLY